MNNYDDGLVVSDVEGGTTGEYDDGLAVVVVDGFYIGVLSAIEQTQSARM